MAATRAASRLQPGEHLDRAASDFMSLMQCYWHEHGTLVMEHTVVQETFVLTGTWALMRICIHTSISRLPHLVCRSPPHCLWLVELLLWPEQRYISSLCTYHVCIRAVMVALLHANRTGISMRHDLQVLNKISDVMLCCSRCTAPLISHMQAEHAEIPSAGARRWRCVQSRRPTSP